MIFNIFKDNSIETLNKITSRYGVSIFSPCDFFYATKRLRSKGDIVAVKDQKIIFDAIKEYSDYGYFYATVLLAECYITGFGTEENSEEGLLLLRKLEHCKDPLVYCDIGVILLFTGRSATEAKKYLTYAAEHGEVGAYFGLGLFYLGLNKGAEYNKSLAIEMFELALKNRDFDVWEMLIPAYIENGEVGKAITILKRLISKNDVPEDTKKEIMDWLSSIPSGDNELLPYPENCIKENVLNWASRHILELNKKESHKIESGKTKNEN